MRLAITKAGFASEDAVATLEVAATDAQTDAAQALAETAALASAFIDHEGAADPHTGYQKESEKAAANGYASLDAGSLVPAAQLATGAPDGTKFLRDDRTWQVGGGGVTDHGALTGLGDNDHPQYEEAGTAADQMAAHTSSANPHSSHYFLKVLVATLAADATTGANTTPIDLTGLVFSYEANSKYRIWAMGRVDPAAATTGCGLQFNLSSTVTAVCVSFYHQLANNGTVTGGHSIADDASVGVSSGLPGTSEYPVVLSALLLTNGNTGTAQLRFRSETTAAITAKAGWTLVVEKIA